MEVMGEKVNERGGKVNLERETLARHTERETDRQTDRQRETET